MNEDHPFGYDTLKLRAVFIPDSNPNNISAADITDYFGHDVVRLRYSWRSSEDGGLELGPAPDRPDGGESAAGPMQDADDPGFAPSGPPTARAMPPTPTLARAPRYVDPVRTAVATWRAINMLSPPSPIPSPSSQPAASHDADGRGKPVARPDAGPAEVAGPSEVYASVQDDPLSSTDPLGRSGDPQGNGQAKVPTPAQPQAPGYVDPAKTAVAAWRAINALLPPSPVPSPPGPPAASHDVDGQGETVTRPDDAGPGEAAGSSERNAYLSNQAAHASVQNGNVVITNDDGSQDIRSGGSISWRDNNPGNVIAGAGGYEPIGHNGDLAIFSDYQTGYNAMIANLLTTQYQALTVGDAIATWAPAKPGNDPVTYAKNVQSWTGVSSDTPMKTLTPSQINSLANAIQRQEGWHLGTVRHVPPANNRG